MQPNPTHFFESAWLLSLLLTGPAMLPHFAYKARQFRHSAFTSTLPFVPGMPQSKVVNA
jgi:hypothetical protein